MIRIPQNIAELVTYKPGKRADEIAVEKQLTAIAKLSSNENTAGASPKAVEAMQKILQNKFVSS